MNEPITLGRDCKAVQIPNGDQVTIPAGTLVRITQSLGGTYTVITEQGYMVRIAGKDADALGKEPVAALQAAEPTSSKGPADVESLVWDQLRTCYDPEIPSNIVDLGLVYSCVITRLPDGGNVVHIRMTLTAPGCGMGEVLRADVERKVLGVPGVGEAFVEVVFDPAWGPSRMSEAAKLQLNML
jgi:probable FeS assembly SUF system protein SufT